MLFAIHAFLRKCGLPCFVQDGHCVSDVYRVHPILYRLLIQVNHSVSLPGGEGRLTGVTGG